LSLLRLGVVDHLDQFPELRIPRHESRDSSLAAEELGVEGEGAAVRPLLSDERSASPAARQAL